MLWLAVAAGVLGVLAALLLLPLRLSLQATSAPIRVRAGVRVMGRFGPALALFDSDRPRGNGRSREVRHRYGARTGNDGHRPIAVRAVVAEAIEILRRVRVENLWVRSRFGCYDPADTGVLFGLLSALRHAGPGDIVIEPDFSGPVLEGEVSLHVAVVPVRLLGPVWRLLRALRGDQR